MARFFFYSHVLPRARDDMQVPRQEEVGDLKAMVRPLARSLSALGVGRWMIPMEGRYLEF